jgi:hypothetical protein
MRAQCTSRVLLLSNLLFTGTDPDKFCEGVIPEYELQPPALDRYRQFDVGQFQFDTTLPEPELGTEEKMTVIGSLDVCDNERSEVDIDKFTRGSVPDYDLTFPALDRYRECDLVDAYRIENRECHINEQKEFSWMLVEQRDSLQETHECRGEQKEFSIALMEQRDSQIQQLLPESKEYSGVTLEQRDSVQDSLQHVLPESKEYSGVTLEQRDSQIQQLLPESKEYSGVTLEQRDSVQDGLQHILPESKEYKGMVPELRDSAHDCTVIHLEGQEYREVLLEQQDSIASLQLEIFDWPCHDDADTSNPDTVEIDANQKPIHSLRCNCTFCRYFSSIP